MDFVVAGFGLGAVLMLVGFAVRDLGPLRYRAQQDDAVARRLWSDLCRRVGAMIVTGGFATCLVTLVLLLAGVGDKTGALLVIAVSALAVVGSGVGSMLTIRAFADARARLRPGYGSVRFEPPSRRFPAPARAVAGIPEEEPDFQVAVPKPNEEISQQSAAELGDEDTGATAEPVLEAVPRAAAEPIFESPLLADLANGSASENGGGFRSSLLADLSAPGHVANGRGYSSSVLADLATDGSDRGADATAVGLPVPEKPGTIGSGTADSDGGAKGDGALSASAEVEVQPEDQDRTAQGDDETARDEAADVVGAPRPAS